MAAAGIFLISPPPYLRFPVCGLYMEKDATLLNNTADAPYTEALSAPF